MELKQNKEGATESRTMVTSTMQVPLKPEEDNQLAYKPKSIIHQSHHRVSRLTIK